MAPASPLAARRSIIKATPRRRGGVVEGGRGRTSNAAFPSITTVSNFHLFMLLVNTSRTGVDALNPPPSAATSGPDRRRATIPPPRSVIYASRFLSRLDFPDERRRNTSPPWMIYDLSPISGQRLYERPDCRMIVRPPMAGIEGILIKIQCPRFLYKGILYRSIVGWHSDV